MRRGIAPSFSRRQTPAIVLARSRNVTTDAASSHAERDHVEGKDEEDAFEVTLSDESFETYELDPPPYKLHTTKKELKQMYRDMVSVRYVLFVRSG